MEAQGRQTIGGAATFPVKWKLQAEMALQIVHCLQRERGLHPSTPTKEQKMVGTWLGEIDPCSCLTVGPVPSWVLLIKIYQPFFCSSVVV